MIQVAPNRMTWNDRRDRQSLEQKAIASVLSGAEATEKHTQRTVRVQPAVVLHHRPDDGVRPLITQEDLEHGDDLRCHPFAHRPTDFVTGTLA